jgi:hypothetical protein
MFHFIPEEKGFYPGYVCLFQSFFFLNSFLWTNLNTELKAWFVLRGSLCENAFEVCQDFITMSLSKVTFLLSAARILDRKKWQESNYLALCFQYYLYCHKILLVLFGIN